MKKLVVFVCLILAACSKSPDLKRSDPKNIFLEHNFPSVKLVRDEIASQINTTNINIGKLVKLKYTFDQEGSKQVVNRKISHLCMQRDVLWKYINKIDVEVEKGMAIQAFNDIDGGGLRVLDIQQTLEDAKVYISQARTMNARINDDYDVVRAIPVR